MTERLAAEPMDDGDLALLAELLERALSDPLAARTVPTPMGRGRKTYGTDVMRALDAVEAEIAARADETNAWWDRVMAAGDDA